VNPVAAAVPPTSVWRSGALQWFLGRYCSRHLKNLKASAVILSESPKWRNYAIQALAVNGSSAPLLVIASFNLIHDPALRLLILGTITVEDTWQNGGIGTAVFSEIIGALPKGYTFRVSSVGCCVFERPPSPHPKKLGFKQTNPWFVELTIKM
jgi:hypothetical protein